MERAVVTECRELGRQVLKAGCNNSPIRPASCFPLRQRKRRPLPLRTELGEVKLTGGYGQAARPGPVA